MFSGGRERLHWAQMGVNELMLICEMTNLQRFRYPDFVGLLIALELQDCYELDLLDLYSPLRLQFSNKKLVPPNILNVLSKFASRN